MKELMPTGWSEVDPDELIGVLLTEFHVSNLLPKGRGVAIPYVGDQCFVEVHVSDEGLLSAIRPGLAFVESRWESIVEVVHRTLLVGTPGIGRAVCVARKRVSGTWASESLSIRISPAPPTSPVAPVVIADHPFTLEFPVMRSTNGFVSNHRRYRETVALTRLLNALLRSGVKPTDTRRLRHTWAYLPGGFDTAWVQEGFNAGLYEPYGDGFMADDSTPMDVIDAGDYYSDRPLLSDTLVVPSDLEDSILRYQGLPVGDRRKFDRSAYWLDLSSRTWELSMSLSFATLVSAVEALVDRGSGHSIDCPQCGLPLTHQVPGATQQFRDFIDMHAAGALTQTTRSELYDVRSGIVHGSDVLHLDRETIGFGSDARVSDQIDLHWTLSGAVRTAVRNWLHTRGR